MKIFVTGASGFIGRAVVPELLNHGHEVLALARSDASASSLTKAGASTIRGDLQDLNALKEGAKASNGVIHLAFMPAFSSAEAFQSATAADRAAITAMAEAMEGTNNPLVICSGTLGYPQGQVSNEDTEPNIQPGFDRDLSLALTYSLSKEKNIRGMLMRLAPVVHGSTDDKGFVPMMAQAAKKNGFAAYPGDGSARWTAVHVDDAAVAFRLAVEKGKAATTYLPIAEGGVSVKEIATAIAKKAGVPAESRPAEELQPLIGFLAMVMNFDTPVNSEKTQKELGWTPKGPALLDDVEANYQLG
ncbi:uncharacterized protein LTR77_002911 [Saxophila tyrrhenica]|uniref:NAD-dependent epimerase/dehydratase domain-containing protein n=1 Tax=Saxophila tyrrhenica TaxID=1690608 RepID=A0AAV9PFZ1_9PEZI|nr:hypothetical protein LTR77_002911 [Saxophila tyrrhenica]